MASPATDDPRAALREATYVVVKVGTRALVGDGAAGAGRFESIADQVAALRASGRTVVLVSSGSIALGCERLKLEQRPQAMDLLQAAAAAGQADLVHRYELAFARHGIPAAQVLLTHAGVRDRERYVNARHAIDALLRLGAIPVINENDTVAVEEIKFGDNDRLAAMVAAMLGADLLVLLTSVEGLLDAQGARVSVVRDPEQARQYVHDDVSDLGLGGMAAKIEAAALAGRRGLPMVVAPAGDERVLHKVIEGQDIGTLFLPAGAPVASRKYWIAYGLKPRGTLTVDAGAARALVEHKRSLLAAGVVDARGDFRPGEAVSIRDRQGRELARGLARYDVRDVQRLLGCRSSEIEQRLGHHQGDEIVHRDDLVIIS